MSEITARLLEDTERELERLTEDGDLTDFLLLSLEREQVAAIAYSEDLLIHRLDQLDVADEVAELLRRVILWTQRDEALHSQYLRGLLVRTRRALPVSFVLARQAMGTVSGWVSAVRHHRPPSHFGLRHALATGALRAGQLLGRIPDGLQDQLNFTSFRHYCELNVALEKSAILSYEHILPMLQDAEQLDMFERILADEVRHAEVFEVLVEAFDENDRLVLPYEELVRRIGVVSPWFLPADLRPVRDRVTVSRLGQGSSVHVSTGDDMLAALDEAIGATELEALVRANPELVVIHGAFMLGYNRDDRSTVLHPQLLEHLAVRMRQWGANRVVVQEGSNVYDRFYGNRSVTEVAEYFGFVSDAYEVVDVADELMEITFDRGLVASTMSRPWHDASLRIVFARLMGDPSEIAHGAMATLCGMSGRTDDRLFTNKMIDHRTAALMAMDVAPPDYALVDAWAPVADGPLGVMGSSDPVGVQRIYAGRDPLSVDAALFADLGFDDPHAAEIFHQADAWFGRASGPLEVTGASGPIVGYKAPQSSPWFRFVSATANPIYFHLSDEGRWFTPEFDTEAFPEIDDPGPVIRAVRRVARRVFGLHPPR